MIRAGLVPAVVILGVAGLLASYAAETDTGDAALITVSETFDGPLARWRLLPESHWRVEEGVLVLHKPGPQRPPVRRPGGYALLETHTWRDVTVEARVNSLRPARIRGRDICILFGYQDDAHFYYAHLCSDSNGRTHNVIMKVSGAKRQMIMHEKRPEPRLTDNWHRVKVTHSAEGRIEVFMDDMDTPLMTADDTDYRHGAVGLGTFDDVAEFDDVTITGVPVQTELSEPLKTD